MSGDDTDASDLLREATALALAVAVGGGTPALAALAARTELAAVARDHRGVPAADVAALTTTMRATMEALGLAMRATQAPATTSPGGAA